MKKVISLLLLCYGILLLSCTEKDMISSKLVAVDSLLYHEYGDSAYNVLEKINASELKEDNYIYYTLLKTKAEYKIYKPIPSDSLINKCVAYYKEHNDKDKLSWAYLYKGLVLKELGRAKDAVICLKNAENIATDGTGTEINIRLYSALSALNTETSDYNVALLYARKALKEAEISRNKRFIGYCLDNMGVVFSYKKNMDSANVYIEKSIPYTSYQPLKEQPYLLNNQALYFWRIKKMDKVEGLLLKSLHIEPQPYTYSILAEFYSTVGKKDMVDSLWSKALQEKRLKSKINSLKPYYTWLKKEGRTEEALKIAELIPALKDSLAQQMQAEAVKEIQNKYDEKIRENTTLKWITAVLMAAILILILAIAMIRSYVRICKREQKAQKEIAANRMMIADYTSLIGELQKNGKASSAEIKKLQRKLDELHERQADILYKGRELYEEILEGGTAVTWNKEKFGYFVEYYRTLNISFIRQLEQDYDSLSLLNMVFLILYEMGYKDKDIKRIMGMEAGAIRTMKSRIKSRRLG